MHDEKELAEHNMLVDLGRNDIGRISKIGTVKVEKYLNGRTFFTGYASGLHSYRCRSEMTEMRWMQ